MILADWLVAWLNHRLPGWSSTRLAGWLMATQGIGWLAGWPTDPVIFYRHSELLLNSLNSSRLKRKINNGQFFFFWFANSQQQCPHMKTGCSLKHLVRKQVKHEYIERCSVCRSKRVFIFICREQQDIYTKEAACFEFCHSEDSFKCKKLSVAEPNNCVWTVLLKSETSVIMKTCSKWLIALKNAL